jgi:hypothetical protein
MSKRKTVNVEWLKDKANILLANPDLLMEEKLGVIAMIEMVLLESDNYNGFRFLYYVNGVIPAVGTDEWTARKYF